MAYSELIKNFEKIRGYMRDFYVYGFKRREEYDGKSSRSYDNERRRVESWLGDHMSFRQDAGGKTVFLTVDARGVPHNPFYKAFKTKSFTDNDITLHFYILDLLAWGEELSVRQIVERISEDYLSCFEGAEEPDESTVRKKLKEYEQLGLLASRKVGRELLFCRSLDGVDRDSWREAVAFFSEADPVGVIGSYFRRGAAQPEYFSFKHHYLLHALDSQVLYELLTAMRERRCVELTSFVSRRGELRSSTVFPLKIYVSTQTGRQYLLAYHYMLRRPMFFRIDNLRRVHAGAVEKRAEKYSAFHEKLRENLWGVSLGAGHSLEHIEMTVRVEADEEYIIDRLEREKRGGSVEVVDKHTYKFVADVYDASEMLTWLRTFIGRVVRLECSNGFVQRQFYEDLAEMERIYGGDGDAVQ